MMPSACLVGSALPLSGVAVGHSKSIRSSHHAGAPRAMLQAPAHPLTAAQKKGVVPSLTVPKRANATVCRDSATQNGVMETPARDTSGWFDLKQPGTQCDQFTVTYKFGGAAVADAERMVEVAKLICQFPEHAPVVVMSAMGKTTNLLLEAAEQCLESKAFDIPSMPVLKEISELHHEAMDLLEIDQETRKEVEDLLQDLEQLLVGISMLQEITKRANDNLVSFGERMSTRIFSAYLRRSGIPSKQFDAWKCGFVSNDNFTSADLDYSKTLPACKRILTVKEDEDIYVPVVTGFLARGFETHAVTTLGRGGSDLTATVIGAALGHDEVQVWKDVDGVLTTDPRLVSSAIPVKELTYHEATELAYFGATVLHPKSMTPADYSPGMAVRVKNAYNPTAPGTLIMKDRCMDDSLLTSLVLKENVTIIDVESNNMFGQFGFMAKVFNIFEKNELSVDVVSTSEVSISVTLDPAKYWSRDLFDEELESLKADMEPCGKVHVQRDASIVSLICNVSKSSEVLEKVFRSLKRMDVNVRMISQGASKTNIALVMDSDKAQEAVQALHLEFYGETKGTGKYSSISK